MVSFNQQDGHEDRLDWQMLCDGGIALYWRRELLEEDVNWFRQQDYCVFSFDCKRWSSTEERHSDFQRTLSFPAHYGRNLADR